MRKQSVWVRGTYLAILCMFSQDYELRKQMSHIRCRYYSLPQITEQQQFFWKIWRKSPKWLRVWNIFNNFGAVLVYTMARHNIKIEALCLHLEYSKPMKLQTANKRRCNGFHAMRGAVIPTSVCKGFPRVWILRRGTYQHYASAFS